MRGGRVNETVEGKTSTNPWTSRGSRGNRGPGRGVERDNRGRTRRSFGPPSRVVIRVSREDVGYRSDGVWQRPQSCRPSWSMESLTDGPVPGTFKGHGRQKGHRGMGVMCDEKTLWRFEIGRESRWVWGGWGEGWRFRLGLGPR